MKRNCLLKVHFFNSQFKFFKLGYQPENKINDEETNIRRNVPYKSNLRFRNYNIVFEYTTKIQVQEFIIDNIRLSIIKCITQFHGYLRTYLEPKIAIQK